MSNVVNLHDRRERTEQVWICAGINKPWRVVSDQRTFGEFAHLGNARKFLWLLILGNDDLDPLIRDEEAE